MNARTPIYTPDLFCISGELRDAPSVRIRPVMEGGHPMPVLTVVLHKVGPYAKTVVCEQVFPEAAIAAAHARQAAQARHALRGASPTGNDGSAPACRGAHPPARQVQTQPAAGG